MDIDVANLKGKNVAQIFEEIEEVDKKANQESVFLQDVALLRPIQVLLKKFNLASPLTNLEPITTSVVFNVVRNVTAVSSLSRKCHSLHFCKDEYMLLCTEKMALVAKINQRRSIYAPI